MRIAVGCIGHETNTFSPVLTTIDNFKKGSYHRGDEIINAFRGTRTITGGFLDVAEQLNLQPVPLLWAFATPSGMVEHAAYQTLKTEFLTLLQNAGELDGVLLDLHGAMVTEELEDAEGDLMQAVRETVGETWIVTTLDLHANITEKMAHYADVIIGFDTYPHVDCYERGFEAGQLLFGMNRGNVQPTMAYRQLPLLTAPPAQCTMKSPMTEVINALHALETERGVVTATLSMGFPFADITDAGVSVLVTTNGDMALAETHADRFAAHIWEMRDRFTFNLHSVEAAIGIAHQTDGNPIVLADGADNPGGGGPCDGTTILRKFIEADVQDAVIAVIADPESVDQAVKAGVGNRVQLNVGGKTDTQHGAPVALTGSVKALSDGRFILKGPMGRGTAGNMGRTAVVQIGGIEIILTERRIQPYDAQVLRSVGIEPKARKLIALKSAVHFRADYTPIAHQILDVDTPGVHSPNLFNYDYQKLRRPIYPLDPTLTYGKIDAT
ncbi:M81 family metallopeptidase [Candidatus Poribacteria bacterium]|nr:M81 family metallopeptidase [Candidatus Poribacteria bacterium]MYA55148.1 M81 family metallopeptidase [Candidatus Poribacteria bacterium]